MSRTFHWWVGDKESGFPYSEEEVRVGSALPSGADTYVAAKMPFPEKRKKKKRRKKGRGRECSWLHQREPFHCR